MKRNGRQSLTSLRYHECDLAAPTSDGKTDKGLILFLNITQGGRQTSLSDNQIAARRFYKNLFPALPEDALGLGIACTDIYSSGV